MQGEKDCKHLDALLRHGVLPVSTTIGLTAGLVVVFFIAHAVAHRIVVASGSVVHARVVVFFFFAVGARVYAVEATTPEPALFSTAAFVLARTGAAVSAVVTLEDKNQGGTQHWPPSRARDGNGCWEVWVSSVFDRTALLCRRGSSMIRVRAYRKEKDEKRDYKEGFRWICLRARGAPARDGRSVQQRAEIIVVRKNEEANTYRRNESKGHGTKVPSSMAHKTNQKHVFPGKSPSPIHKSNPPQVSLLLASSQIESPKRVRMQSTLPRVTSSSSTQAASGSMQANAVSSQEKRSLLSHVQLQHYHHTIP